VKPMSVFVYVLSSLQTVVLPSRHPLLPAASLRIQEFGNEQCSLNDRGQNTQKVVDRNGSAVTSPFVNRG